MSKKQTVAVSTELFNKMYNYILILEGIDVTDKTKNLLEAIHKEDKEKRDSYNRMKKYFG